jgi:hypothetical protein
MSDRWVPGRKYAVGVAARGGGRAAAATGGADRIGGLVSVGRHESGTTMDDDERYEAACRAFNEALGDGNAGPIELKLSATEREVLLSALAHHREIVDPHSGDAVGRTEYACPGCGSDAEFRAQDGQVSTEANHPEVGVEVRRCHGTAQCHECRVLTEVTLFDAVRTEGFDEAAWEELYGTVYRPRERAERL